MNFAIQSNLIVRKRIISQKQSKIWVQYRLYCTHIFYVKIKSANISFFGRHFLKDKGCIWLDVTNVERSESHGPPEKWVESLLHLFLLTNCSPSLICWTFLPWRTRCLAFHQVVPLTSTSSFTSGCALQEDHQIHQQHAAQGQLLGVDGRG